MRVEGRGFDAPSVPLVADVTELIVGQCKRESNQPRPGVAPGDPQHEAEGWTLCPRGREHAQRCSESSKSFCTAKQRPRQNDVLENGRYQMRPAHHGRKRSKPQSEGRLVTASYTMQDSMRQVGEA
jgi:hypothetical protein